MLYDVHTHAIPTINKGTAVFNIRFGQQFYALSALSTLPAHPTLPEHFSVGIHPWDAGSVQINDDFLRLASKADAIGECGLDKCHSVPMDVQREAFCRQIEIANLLGKPVIVHCVQCYGTLLELSRLYDGHTPWIIHSVYASDEWIRQSLGQEFYYSVSASSLRNKRAEALLQSIPRDRLLVETDEGQDVDETYNICIDVLQLERADFELQIETNFRRVFKID